jgi:hypothetical protein
MNTFAGELAGRDGLPLSPAAENQFAVSIDVYSHDVYPQQTGVEQEQPKHFGSSSQTGARSCGSATSPMGKCRRTRVNSASVHLIGSNSSLN